MTGPEAREAMLSRTPVHYNGIDFICITAITYRTGPVGDINVTLELLDKCKHSVTIANIKDVTIKGD